MKVRARPQHPSAGVHLRRPVPVRRVAARGYAALVMIEEGEWGSRIEHFLATRQISQRTMTAYRGILRRFQSWCDTEGLHTPDAVSASAMSRYYSIQVASLAPSSVSLRFGVLRTFYQWLVSEGVCSSSPLQDIKFRQPAPVIRDTLSIEQMKRLWQTATSPLDRATVALLGINSLRLDEVAKARTADLGTRENHHVLNLPNRSAVFGMPYTVLAEETFAAIMEHVGDRRHGQLLLNGHGDPLSRRSIARIVIRLGKDADLPFRVVPLTLTFSMRAISIEKGFSYAAVVTSSAEIDTRRLARWMERAPNAMDNHAALRMARLVIGTGDETQDLFMHARTILREGDAPPGVAAAFAGAVLEKHLRELVEARTGSTVEDRRAKLGRFAADLKRIKVFTASEVQLVNRIEGFRDNGAHGRFQNSGHGRRAGRPCLLSRNGFRASWILEVQRHVRITL